MKKQQKFINEGGINGLGEALVNQNAESFKELKKMISAHSQGQPEARRTENELLSIRFQIETYLNEEGEEIIPPGTFIEKMIEAIGVTKARFSKYIDYDYSNLIAVLKGRRKINPDLAIKIGNIFGINPVVWLHVESKNELSKYIREEKPEGNYSLAGLIN